MKIDEIKELMKAMEESGLCALDYSEGGVNLSLRRGSLAEAQSPMAAPAVNVSAVQSMAAPAKAPEASAAAASEASAKAEPEANKEEPTAKEGKLMLSPLVGTFYAAASPEDEPYVKIGDKVKKGQTLGIIEAMKLMNEVEAEFDGTVEEILVENGQMVEYGQPLFRIV